MGYGYLSTPPVGDANFPENCIHRSDGTVTGSRRVASGCWSTLSFGLSKSTFLDHAWDKGCVPEKKEERIHAYL